MSQPSETEQRVSSQEMFRTSPILSVLTAIVFINWFVFFGISMHFGGDALRVLPSQDGFVVTNHGHKTVVTESVWLFCLIYPYCTLMLTPAVCLLFGARQKILRSATPALRWFVIVFVCLWVVGWYGSITKSFIRSLQDYRALKDRKHALEPAASRAREWVAVAQLRRGKGVTSHKS